MKVVISNRSCDGRGLDSVFSCPMFICTDHVKLAAFNLASVPQGFNAKMQHLSLQKSLLLLILSSQTTSEERTCFFLTSTFCDVYLVSKSSRKCQYIPIVF